ncbi:lysosomal alpha-mannosidase, putative [Perkinsus marinus ATCC 50983]|uniref:Lysosomal alpha-mannosidase, putative n=1 Tax=Perkinsus marinus (strain ATCC 50983 / TXsc) TaxID=423536 RepID=C5K5D2_PERM5|nr:lysosomal alpha-mannosidase, putative [Perkinsus marinus ATCC 50983]EER20554.1 lysosomal alpha-mannosidase, putative [Perkinsus marinus ATCC 50983]|eukprot:XP_002788758.1 lysosomal alpha-mannosidase, putative [Perkinsus marinus ATCC 50983]
MAIREATGALEMVYRTRKENGSHTVDNFDGIFMGLMHMYSPPTGFHFDLLASDPPVQDDPMVEDVNVMHRLDSLRHICLKQAKSYNPENGERGKSQNIILTMGMDFNYQQAKTWFQNMDKLIHYSKLVADQQLSDPRNSSHILNVFYSNPKIYIKSRHAQYDGGVGLPIKNSDEDFFPYGDGEVEVVDVAKRTVDAVDGGHAYWTGITSGTKGQTAACPQEQQLSGQPSASSATSVGNENYKLFYGGDEGSGGPYRFTLKNLKAGLEVRFNVILGYYNSSTGSGENIYGRPYQASGAYIFRPDCPEAPDVRSIRSCRPEMAITPTILMGQADDGSTLRVNIAQQSSEEGSAPALIGNLSLSIPPKESAVVISWDVAIDDGDGVGKEAVLLLDTDINNHDGDFLTDSNGRDWVPRRVNYRKDWQLNVTDPVAMNYYPINSGLRISDQVGKGSNLRQLTLVPDRAHGGASLLPGQLEIMIHRRMLFDDGRGVGEALDEVDCGKSLCLPKLVTGETRLLLEPVRTSTTEEESHDNYREMAHQVRLPLLPIFAHDDPKNPPKADEWSSLGGLTACKPLPREIQILTLELLHANNTPKLYYEKACAHHRCALLRVAHTYAQEEGGSPIQLDLAGKGTLLKDFELGPGFEVTLNAGRDIKTAEEERLKWSVHGVQSRRPVHDEGSHRVDWASVELQPLQIRTFIVTLLL